MVLPPGEEKKQQGDWVNLKQKEKKDMAKKTPKNNNLTKARVAKNDEFYTVIADIEKEMNAYYDHNPNVFRGKTILCPCDDPEWSNFTKYFTMNFKRLGIKKLICTCYNKEEGGHGKMLVLTGDTNGNGKIEADDIVATEMEGNGDFGSEEVKKLLEEADFVITNPPFSLFSEFIAWIMESKKKFSVIGNVNAITYKEVFPLIKNNKMWIGATNFNKGMYFRVPDDYEYADTYKFDREHNGTKVMRVPATCWFTNIDHDVRHEKLDLSTKNQLKKKGITFPKYDNYNAIEVSEGVHIPRDHKGVMGVPVTWLGKYCPEQFEIMGMTNGIDDSEVPCTGKNKTPKINGKKIYIRLLIKHKS